MMVCRSLVVLPVLLQPPSLLPDTINEAGFSYRIARNHEETLQKSSGAHFLDCSCLIRRSVLKLFGKSATIILERVFASHKYLSFGIDLQHCLWSQDGTHKIVFFWLVSRVLQVRAETNLQESMR